MFTPDTQQQEVIDIQSGRYAVLAPPGAGKTELLAQRLKRALADGVPPRDIVCLTFTNRAARLMNERIGIKAQGVFIGNFHAFALMFLKQAGVFGTQNVVLDEALAEDVLSMAFDRLRHSDTPDDPERSLDNLLTEAEKHIDPALVNYFGMARTGVAAERRPLAIAPTFLSGLLDRLRDVVRPFMVLMTALKYKLSPKLVAKADQAIKEQLNLMPPTGTTMRPLVWSIGILLGLLKLVEKHYTDIKTETLAFDYDDLLFETLRWLNENPSHRLSRSYKWVQLDEAQDLNDIQWEIFDRLVHPDACVVVFADPQQAIYSFMGASFETLKQHVDSMTCKYLSTNYRSPPQLLEFFTAYARRNLDYAATWVPSDASQPGNGTLDWSHHEDDSSEREYLATKLIPGILKQEDGKVAVLARTNKGAMLCSEALSQGGVLHFVVSEFDLFQLRITKDFMAFLQSLEQPTTRLPWVRLFALNNRSLPLTSSLHFVNQCRGAGILPHWVLDGSMSLTQYPPMQMLEAATTGRLVVLDTETTGTDTAHDDIIQFAAAEIVQGQLGRSFSVFLKTDKDLGDSEAVHHISKDTLSREGLERAEGFRRILEFIGDADIAAHNLPFDLGMLENNLRQTLGKSFAGKRRGFCTLQTTIALDPTSRRHNLEYLIERYGLSGANTHDARDDVFATAQLILHFRKKIEQQSPIALGFFREHVKSFARFHQTLAPLWIPLRSDFTGDTTFNKLFDCFLAGLPEAYYEPLHVEGIRSKLLRHATAFAPPACLRTLLERDLHLYSLYKEADLILEDDRVVVSTIHRAKGLEFDTVIVPDCHSSAFPSFFAKNDAAKKKEDARLLFVALTRAKRRLIVAVPDHYTTERGNLIRVECSPFLASLLPYFRPMRSDYR